MHNMDPKCVLMSQSENQMGVKMAAILYSISLADLTSLVKCGIYHGKTWHWGHVTKSNK